MLFALTFVIALATPSPLPSATPIAGLTPAPTATATPCGPDGSGCGGSPVGTRGPRTPTAPPTPCGPDGSGCSGSPTGMRGSQTPTATPAPCNPYDGSGCGGSRAGTHVPEQTPDPVASKPGAGPTPDPRGPRGLIRRFLTWPVAELGEPRVPRLTASQAAEARRVSAALGVEARLLMFAFPADTFVLYARNPAQPQVAGTTRGVIGSHCRLAYRLEPGAGELVSLIPSPLQQCVETAADKAAGG